jgi:hypothetical protein
MKRAVLGLLALGGVAILAFLAGRVGQANAFPIPGDTGGHDHVAGVVSDAENCGTYVRGAESSGSQTDPATFNWVADASFDATALAAPDHRWAHDADDDFLVVDLGHAATKVDLFPSIDHDLVPDEALEVTVYGSNDLSAAESTWEAGDITTLFEEGFDAAWVSDDFVSRWSFSIPYRYVGVHWGGPKALEADGDAEIDAVCGPNLPPDCSELSAGQDLWPPNHKYRLVTVGGATDPDGDALTYTITGVTQDEALDGAADGHTSPDAAWVADPGQVKVRAERSGRGDGRVYRIAVDVSDGTSSCQGAALLGVPHDRGKHRTPIESPLVVDSFGA